MILSVRREEYEIFPDCVRAQTDSLFCLCWCSSTCRCEAVPALCDGDCRNFAGSDSKSAHSNPNLLQGKPVPASLARLVPVVSADRSPLAEGSIGDSGARESGGRRGAGTDGGPWKARVREEDLGSLHAS